MTHTVPFNRASPPLAKLVLVLLAGLSRLKLQPRPSVTKINFTEGRGSVLGLGANTKSNPVFPGKGTTGIRAFKHGDFLPLSTDLRSLRSKLLTEIGPGKLRASTEPHQDVSLLQVLITGWILGLHQGKDTLFFL